MARRLFCYGCRREFLTVQHPIAAGDGCPACGDDRCNDIDYRPGVAGADLPRDPDGYPVFSMTATVIPPPLPVEPALVLVGGKA